MQTELVSFDKVSQFSQRDKAYQRGDERLTEFLSFAFDEDELENLVNARSKFEVNREVLVKELTRQYQGTPFFDKLYGSISALRNKSTFTVITAHQPSLLMGPLYYVYKICSAINVARKWSKKGHTVLPVFILGAEDHDFEEIDHFTIFNKEIKWQREKEGATGRMTVEGLDEVVKLTEEVLGQTMHAEDLKLKMAYAQNNSATYGEFMFNFINQLFHEHGVITVNFDNKAFKNLFRPLIKKEIVNQFSKPLVTSTQGKLEEKGFGQQAFVRDINFFYMTADARRRIEKKGDKYIVLNSDLSFSESEILQEIEDHPENFSPNVVMRPLIQELIMPNLAYIGGGGELAYWMERKSQFEAAKVFFPMLIRRKSAMWINSHNIKTLKQLELTFNDLLQKETQLISSFAIDNSEHSIDIQSEITALKGMYHSLENKAGPIDKTLVPKIQAQRAKHINEVEKLQARMIRTLKARQETQINKIYKVRQQLFPNNGLQERTTNFMQFYVDHGNSMIEFLIQHCDPFVKELLVIYDDK